MKTLRNFIVCIAMFTLGVSALSAQTSERVFANEFAGLRFKAPTGWYTMSDETTREITESVSYGLGSTTQEVEDLSRNLSNIHLLTVSELPYDPESMALVNNISINAINCRGEEDVLPGIQEILESAGDAFMEYLPGAKVSSISKMQLAGKEFHHITITGEMDGVSFYQHDLVTLHNDYIVMIVSTAFDENQMKAMDQLIASNLEFFAVDEAVDLSPEGESFRDQTTLDFSDEYTESSTGTGRGWYWIPIVLFSLLGGGGAANSSKK
jgi:hypothetical protein